MVKRKSKGRVVSKGVQVDAVKANRGHAAASVSVRLERDKLKEDVPALERIDEVIAEVPEPAPSEPRWREQRLERIESKPGAAGSVDVYSRTHYGPHAAKDEGVRIKLRTNAGEYAVQRKDEVHQAHEPDQPGPSPRVRHKRF